MGMRRHGDPGTLCWQLEKAADVEYDELRLPAIRRNNRAAQQARRSMHSSSAPIEPEANSPVASVNPIKLPGFLAIPSIDRVFIASYREHTAQLSWHGIQY